MVVQGTGAVSYERGTSVWSTRWTTSLSLKLDFPDEINFKSVCGIDLVTSASKCEEGDQVDSNSYLGLVMLGLVMPYGCILGWSDSTSYLGLVMLGLCISYNCVY